MPTDASVDDNATFCDDNSVQRMNTWCGIGNPDLTNPIVAIAVFDCRHDDPEFDANINLIAAAPELYEALSDIMENPLFQTAIGGSPNMVERLMDSANAALRKARGQQ
jgi:hypothetical protein